MKFPFTCRGLDRSECVVVSSNLAPTQFVVGKCTFFGGSGFESSRVVGLLVGDLRGVSYDGDNHRQPERKEMMRDHHLEHLERRRRRRRHHRDDGGGGGGGGEGGSAAQQHEPPQARRQRRCWNLSSNVLAVTVVVAAATIVSNWAGVNCQGEFRRLSLLG